MTTQAIRQVKQILIDLKLERFIEDKSGITLPSGIAGAFSVGFSENFHEYTVHFGDWQGHFIKTNLDDALNCLIYGLTQPTRIKIYARQGVRYKWQLQFREKGKWSNYTSCQKFAYPYLGKLTLEYQENYPLEELAA